MASNGKITVLHCIETIGSGGVEQRRLTLSRSLDKETFQQHLTCAKVLGNFDRKLQENGMLVYTIGTMRHPLNLKYYWQLIKVVRRVKPTIIHGAVFEGVISAAIVGTLCRVPVIILEETSDPQNRSWRGHLLLRLLSFFADFVVAISPSVEKYLKNEVHVAKHKIKLINNGVDSPAIPDDITIANLRRQLGIADDDFVIGSVGRLRDFHKRFSDLIKALKLLLNVSLKFRLLIVGDGEDRDLLKRLATELGVEKNVIFAGFQTNTGPFYACMDVFSLASHMEGFGLVIVEAMFFKLPVVATAVGGIKDIVVEGETGLLVARHSPEEIAKGVEKIYSDPDLKIKMGLKGFERAVAEYSGEAYTGKVDALYRGALKRKGIELR